MKKIALLTFLAVITSDGFAQILNQDAEGKSSILWNGASIGLDLPDGLIKVNYYSVSREPTGILWGIDLQGKSQSGASDLFRKGEFTPKTEISGLAGWHKTYFKIPAGQAHADRKLEELYGLRQEAIENAETRYFELIDEHITGCEITEGVKDNETGNVLARLRSIMVHENMSQAVLRVVSIVDDDQCAILINEIETLSEKVKEDEIINRLTEINREIDRVAAVSEELVPNSRFMIYTRGGLKTLDFKMDRGQDYVTFNERFVDHSEVSLFGELGATFQWKWNFAGLSLGVEEANNFSSLTKNEYRFTQTDMTLEEGTLQQTRTIEAYSGSFDSFTRFNVTLDYLRMYPLNESNYISLSGYFRQRFSGDTELEDHTSVLGIGTYLINGKTGKFLGGLYVQTDDLFGNTEPSFGKTIRFGLITKFTLSSIFPGELN